MNVSDLRHEYMQATLDEASVARNPFSQFNAWFEEAVKAQMPMVNAMALATVAGDGRPSVRMVLLKHVDTHGFAFYTNYESRKGRDLAAHAVASLLFHWLELERQVRVDGRVEKVSAQEADEYFAQRPLASRYAAAASPQSTVIADRAELEARFAEAARKCGANPPRPAHWGGYRVIPDAIEFWQGRENRLHDRLLYRRTPDQGWRIERLAP